jgi:hypothetical protein
MGRSTSFWTNRWKWVTRTFDTFFFFWILLEEESLFSLKPHSFRAQAICAREGNMSTESPQTLETFADSSQNAALAACQAALQGARPTGACLDEVPRIAPARGKTKRIA